MKNKKQKKGYVVFKNEFQKGIYHIKLRIEEDAKVKEIDVIWNDNQIDITSGQYIMAGNLIFFDLTDGIAKNGKKYKKLIVVKHINMEYKWNKIENATLLAKLKQPLKK